MYKAPISLPLIPRIAYWLGMAHLSRKGELQSGLPEEHNFKPSIGKSMFAWGEKKLLEYCKKHVPEHLKDIQVQEVSAEEATPELMRQTRKQQLPILIKGGAKNWKAYKEFNLDFFADNYGDIEVPAHSEPNKVFEDDGKPIPLKNFYQMSYVKIKDLVKSIRTDEKYSAKAIEDIMHTGGGSLIKEYCDLNHIHYLSDLGEYMKKWYFKKIPVGYTISEQLFLQSKRSHTLWHTEPGYNFFVAVQGTKDWKVTAPMFSPGLYPVIKDNSTYHVSKVDGRESNQVIANRGFELYKYMPKYAATVEPGDIFVIPPWWWHTVTNRPTEPSISLTFRTLAEPNIHAPMFNFLKDTDPKAKEIRRKVLKYGRLFDEDIAASLYAFADPKNDLTQKAKKVGGVE